MIPHSVGRNMCSGSTRRFHFMEVRNSGTGHFIPVSWIRGLARWESCRHVVAVVIVGVIWKFGWPPAPSVAQPPWWIQVPGGLGLVLGLGLGFSFCFRDWFLRFGSTCPPVSGFGSGFGLVSFRDRLIRFWDWVLRDLRLGPWDCDISFVFG